MPLLQFCVLVALVESHVFLQVCDGLTCVLRYAMVQLVRQTYCNQGGTKLLQAMLSMAVPP